MTPHHTIQVLDSLYVLAQCDRRADVGAIAEHLGLRPTQVGEAMVHLEAKGLVDAERGRLTMRGLAASTALRAARRTRSRAA
ncbi:MAG: hypothetical protein AAGF12_01275 [Myxococcota bacterium]